MANEKGPVDPTAAAASLGPGLLIRLDRAQPGTLHEQLERELRELIRSGRLSADARMPSTRVLASELSLSRGVVLEAYSQLTAEGYLVASQGAPTRVGSVLTAEPAPALATPASSRLRFDFDPTLPDLTAFPREQWMRSLRAAGRRASFAGLGHADPRGTAGLRNELMAYLSRVRGAAPEPEHTLITAGFASGFATLCRLLAGRGIEQIAVEEPGSQSTAAIVETAGLTAIPVPADEHGIDVERLAASGAEVVVITPAHQYPTGVVLTAERRAALLEWADDVDALIVEDDYDSELRYDREAVGALQGLSPERVANLGSFSVRLAPGLKLGWMLSPSWLTGGLTYERGIAGGAPPVLDQLALADFIARGELDRHLRRSRLRYRARREALMTALGTQIPEATPVGAAAGLFTALDVPLPASGAAVISAAAAAGVGIETFGDRGLVLGVGAIPDGRIAAGIAALASSLGR